MAQDTSFSLPGQERGDWVRLRTLVILRWFAVAGQITAIIVALYFFEMQLEVGLIAATVGLSILANIFSTFLYPENRRLSEREAVLMMGFDLLQLGALLFLSGGLNNPFALLILAPVTVSASVLPARATILLGAVAMAIITLLSMFNVPLVSASGDVLAMPSLFVFGFWVALMIGTVFIGIYAWQVTREMVSMSDALTATQMALAREQKLTDLGGVVAAAAHELGTPLATIKLVSAELMDELEDKPDLLEDARLIREQADRCRDILRSMGRAGKDDKHLRRAPLEAVIREAAEPHTDRGKTVMFDFAPEVDPVDQPQILRRPEIIHGLRNLIQNAVDFAQSSVLIEMGWAEDTITVRISDDGEGFPTSVLGRIGDPFVRRRRWSLSEPARPGYEGMGLGLFITKTLLERTGARMSFTNGGARVLANRPGGAIVMSIWSRGDLGEDDVSGAGGLGDNERFG